MKGLAVTILLAILEITAISASSGDGLLSDGATTPANRKEEAGIQAEVLVDAEHPEVVGEIHPGYALHVEGRSA